MFKQMNVRSPVRGKWPLAVLAATLLAPIAGAPTAGAQIASAEQSVSRVMQSAADSTNAAVQLLAVGSADEIAAAKLALSRATRADVKAFAQRMIDDHRKALQQLGDSASAGGWVRPDSTMWSDSLWMDSSTMRGGAGGMVGSARGSGMGGGAAGGMRSTADSGRMRRAGAQGGSGRMMRNGQTDSTGMYFEGAMTLHRNNAAALRRLVDADSSDFDTRYINAQIQAHQALLNALEKHPTSNAHLRPMIASLTDTVQSHLTAARALAAQKPL